MRTYIVQVWSDGEQLGHVRVTTLKDGGFRVDESTWRRSWPWETRAQLFNTVTAFVGMWASPIAGAVAKVVEMVNADEIGAPDPDEPDAPTDLGGTTKVPF